MSEAIAAYYDRLAAAHGNTPQAVDAPTAQALEARHAALAQVADMNWKRVLEVGCGHGVLGAYLTSRYPDITYRGIDISAGLLAVGRQARPELDLRHLNLMELDPGRRFDVVVAQGIFYKLGRDAWAKTRLLVEKMWLHADEAVAFTAVSTWRPTFQAGEFYVNPVTMLDFCWTLTPRVVLRHDYHPGDVCFYLYRKDV